MHKERKSVYLVSYNILLITSNKREAPPKKREDFTPVTCISSFTLIPVIY